MGHGSNRAGDALKLLGADDLMAMDAVLVLGVDAPFEAGLAIRARCRHMQHIVTVLCVI